MCHFDIYFIPSVLVLHLDFDLCALRQIPDRLSHRGAGASVIGCVDWLDAGTRSTFCSPGRWVFISILSCYWGGALQGVGPTVRFVCTRTYCDHLRLSRRLRLLCMVRRLWRFGGINLVYDGLSLCTRSWRSLSGLDSRTTMRV